jgi:hypothetical protein
MSGVVVRLVVCGGVELSVGSVRVSWVSRVARMWV